MVLLSVSFAPMPAPSEILEELTRSANDWRVVSMAWHVAVAAVIAILISGWRPSRRMAGVLFALPLLSVAFIAALAHNPFNATALGVVGIALISIAITCVRDRVAPAPRWAIASGAAMILFGLVYPHFVTVSGPLEYLYAAPVGVVPCPSLSVVVGFTLVADGLRSVAYTTIVITAALFYGLFGALHFGIDIDIFLVAGACALLGLMLQSNLRRCLTAKRT